MSAAREQGDKFALSDVEPPADRSSERAVLALMLQSDVQAKAARSMLRVDDFYLPAHALIFGTICDLLDMDLAHGPIEVMHQLRRERILTRAGGANYLHDVYATPAASDGSYYAVRLRDAARARQSLMVAQRIAQAVDELAADPDRMGDVLAYEAVALTQLVDAPAFNAPIEGLGTWDSLWAEPDSPLDWIVPDLIEREDVFMVLGTEGGGKSWLTRQFCLAIAAGVHPWRPSLRITPRRTLLCDLENSRSMVRRQSRSLGAQIIRLGEWDTDRAQRWLYPQGLNLRRHADAALLERVVAETRPEFIGFGSLYKAYQRGKDDWDTAAAEVRAVLDRLRQRYGVAFFIEHHMPKGDGKDRPQNPFGSSEWSRWVSHGHVIRRVGENAYSFDAWRGDRDARQIPVGLTRGGEMPGWSPIWDPDELEYLSDPEHRKTKSKAR